MNGTERIPLLPNVAPNVVHGNRHQHVVASINDAIRNGNALTITDVHSAEVVPQQQQHRVVFEASSSSLMMPVTTLTSGAVFLLSIVGLVYGWNESPVPGFFFVGMAFCASLWFAWRRLVSQDSAAGHKWLILLFGLWMAQLGIATSIIFIRNQFLRFPLVTMSVFIVETVLFVGLLVHFSIPRLGQQREVQAETVTTLTVVRRGTPNQVRFGYDEAARPRAASLVVMPWTDTSDPTEARREDATSAVSVELPRPAASSGDPTVAAVVDGVAASLLAGETVAAIHITSVLEDRHSDEVKQAIDRRRRAFNGGINAGALIDGAAAITCIVFANMNLEVPVLSQYTSVFTALEYVFLLTDIIAVSSTINGRASLLKLFLVFCCGGCGFFGASTAYWLLTEGVLEISLYLILPACLIKLLQFILVICTMPATIARFEGAPTQESVTQVSVSYGNAGEHPAVDGQVVGAVPSEYGANANAQWGAHVNVAPV